MKYFVKTFGCQANEADSEKIAAVLVSQGQHVTSIIEDAQVVIINTCSVRESAEHRVMGLVNKLAKFKKRPKIIVTGCMLYHPKRWLVEKMPLVDEFKPIKDFKISPIPNSHYPISALVSIMDGCDNFCSYCVVPYARGREKSRSFEEIICEAEELVRRGTKEITLLGQNVNSYGKDFNETEKNRLVNMYHRLVHDTHKNIFALLLKVLHHIENLKKISFLTSNPWDLSDEIIEALKLPKIDRYLHLPVQSGDNEILRRMNRHYTVEDYLQLVRKIRKAIPEIKIGTDIIVGFPGETEKQFQNTVDLCKKVGFVKAYISRYSPRPGTAAAKFKDDVPPLEKKKRWQVLEKLINEKEK